MPAISQSAPGKAILLGEHAVVYNRPAIAVPVTQVKAKTIITANPQGKTGTINIDAPDIQLICSLDELSDEHPLSLAIYKTQAYLGMETLPTINIRITSTIPVSAGLGSGAAVSVSLIRAFSSFLGHPLSNEQVSNLAYQVEKIHHGTPSGIDNTVIAFAKPVYFNRNLVSLGRSPFEFLKVSKPFSLVIANTGIQCSTAETVSGVRLRWQKDTPLFEAFFEQIGLLVEQGRRDLEQGNISTLGLLLTQNHAILQKMGVSCPKLDQLVDAAIRSGALGAKLSGGGGGGNMIALVHPDTITEVSQALLEAGAVQIYITHIKAGVSDN